MSGSNRSERIAPLANQTSNQSLATQQGSAGDEQTGQPEAKVLLPAKQMVSQPEAQPADKQTRTEQVDPYELRDLFAQEDMAFYALLMFLAALATFIVTSAGTILIWQQVKLTRRAVEDTGEATVAMREANQIADGTAQRQLRAYVTTEDHDIIGLYPSGPTTLRLKVYNRGQTPAHKVRIWSIVTATSDDPDALKMRHRGGLFSQSSSIIGPGQWVLHTNGCQGPLDGAAYSAIALGELKLVFAGVVSYRDVFGRRHFTTFKQFYHGAKGDFATKAADLCACGRGNVGS